MPRDLFIEAAAKKHGVDPSLVYSIASAESAGNPNSRDSGKGAIGQMQLMPGTARDMGVDPRDPIQNIEGGVKYLKQQLQRYGGDPIKAVAAYNAGPGAVDKYGGVPPYAETQNYVPKVIEGVKPEPVDLFEKYGVKPDATPAPAQPSIYALHPKSYRDEHAEQLRAIQVDQEGKHAETGRTVKYKQAAIDAFDDLDTRITFANRLMECLKS